MWLGGQETKKLNIIKIMKKKLIKIMKKKLIKISIRKKSLRSTVTFDRKQAIITIKHKLGI